MVRGFDGINKQIILTMKTKNLMALNATLKMVAFLYSGNENNFKKITHHLKNNHLIMDLSGIGLNETKNENWDYPRTLDMIENHLQNTLIYDDEFLECENVNFEYKIGKFLDVVVFLNIELI